MWTGGGVGRGKGGQEENQDELFIERGLGKILERLWSSCRLRCKGQENPLWKLLQMSWHQYFVCVCVCLVTQLYPTLCNPMDSCPPGSSVHGIFQVSYWSQLLFPIPGDLPNPGIEPASPESPALAGGFFTTAPPEKPQNYDCCCVVTKSCPTLLWPHGL